MIHYISAYTAKWLLKSGAVSENDVELYEYAVYSFLFGILPICLAAIIGVIFGRVVDGILMIFPFVLIRKFSGGFHLKSTVICFVSSTLLIAISLFIMQIIDKQNDIIFFSVVVIISSFQIFICSPIDNEARKLTKKNMLFSKKMPE